MFYTGPLGSIWTSGWALTENVDPWALKAMSHWQVKHESASASRLQKHESRLQKYESRLQKHESRLQKYESRLQKHESRLQKHESRLQKYESKLAET